MLASFSKRSGILLKTSGVRTINNLQTRCFGSVQVQSSEEARKVNHDEAQLMTSSEAFVETLVAHGVTDVFGIVGSAFMDVLDLFPEAGIRFISTQHEQNAVHMADGYSRISGKHGVCVAQNGPGITNFITGLAAAYYANSPVIAITPECGTNTKGLGGFQEMDQLPLFNAVTKYQCNIVNSSRIAEQTSTAFNYSMYERGPAQINIPRDVFYNEDNYKIPRPISINYPSASPQSINNAIDLLLTACNPCILAGGGVLMNNRDNECVNIIGDLSKFLSIPVATTYLHNDSYPSYSSCDLSVGPLGYQGSMSAMKCVADSDVILCIGTRINPFGILPQYGFNYWSSDKKIIQIDIDQRKLGLTLSSFDHKNNVYIHGDAYLSTKEILNGLKSKSTKSDIKCLQNRNDRMTKIASYKQEWNNLLNEWTFNQQYGEQNKISPRIALRELENAMPSNAMVSTDIGNICSVSNSYLKFDYKKEASFLAAMTFGNCQYALGAAMGAKIASPQRPAISYQGDGAFGMSFNELLTCLRENIAITSIVFNNGQWGAEKKNQVLWFGDRYIGVNLNNPSNFSFYNIAKGMNLEAIQCSNSNEIGDALKLSIDNQLNKNKTTVIEIMCTKELGDPFRRDAMKLPKRYLNKYKHTQQTQESKTGQPTDL